MLHYRLGQALGHSVPSNCQPTTNYLSIISGTQWVQEWPGDSNINLDTGLDPEWFPEYTVDLGAAIDPLPTGISSYFDPTWHVYVRHYAKGAVLVNPTGTSHAINLSGTYCRVNPIGGGPVPPDGSEPGSLNYTLATSITLNPNQAAILLNQAP